MIEGDLSAIGTCHGLYPKGMKPDSEIAQSVTLGINKINISSDIIAAYYVKIIEILADEGLKEPNTIQPPCIAAMNEVACHKIHLFQADGKAALY